MPSLSLNLVDNYVHHIFPTIKEIIKHCSCSCVRQWLQSTTIITAINACLSTSFIPTSCSRAIVLDEVLKQTTVYRRNGRTAQLKLLLLKQGRRLEPYHNHSF
jgi:hypothetical protein